MKKPARVVRLNGQPARKPVIDWEKKYADRQKIRDFDKAGFNEFNNLLVARLKRSYVRRYGEKI